MKRTRQRRRVMVRRVRFPIHPRVFVGVRETGEDREEVQARLGQGLGWALAGACWIR